MRSAAAVEADALVKVYPGDVRAVNGISFTVQRGESFGLLGPNGAGKTTTIGMLNTSVVPTSGRARLAGHDVAADPAMARAHSSVVFQSSVVDRPLSGRQNLLLHLRLWGEDGRSGRARMDELASAVGLTGILDRAVASYSGGQVRRLEVVRALLSQPDVLFLDEPTVGLDTRIRHDLFDVIATLRERTGVTIVMTTHYLDEAEKLCDRLAIIDAGAVVACDSPSNLLRAVGDDVLEIRSGQVGAARQVLRGNGFARDDVLVIGGTITAALHGRTSAQVLALLEANNVAVRHATTRPATLDDVYLRLTGTRIGASPDAAAEPERNVA